jgi:hypothetical protein
MIDWVARRARWLMLPFVLLTLVLLAFARFAGGAWYYIVLIVFLIPAAALGVRRDHLLRPRAVRADDDSRERTVVTLLTILGTAAWLIVAVLLTSIWFRR